MVNVTANALPDGARYNRDNVVVTITFEDGSIANLVYLANGDRSIAKEQFEVFCESRVGRITDFSTLELARDGKIKRVKTRRDKGHDREIQLTLEMIRRGDSSPIPFDDLVEVSEATLAVEEAIATGKPVALRPTA
jgi:polar amino acid transport system substrate-binding protein